MEGATAGKNIAEVELTRCGTRLNIGGEERIHESKISVLDSRIYPKTVEKWMWAMREIRARDIDLGMES